MFSHGLNVDEELGLFSSSTISSQGRFSLELLSGLLQAPGILPLAPYVMLALAYIASYSLILSLHGLQHNWKTQLGFLVFILYPTNWLTQEWSGLAAGLALGLTCTTLAAWLTQRIVLDKPPLADRRLVSLAIIALLILSLSTFQSQITVYIAIAIGASLFQVSTRNGTTGSPRWRDLRTWGLHAITAVVLYSVLVKAFLWATKQTIQHVNIYFRSPYFMLRTEPLKYLAGNLDQLLRTYFDPGMFYGHPLWALPLILIGSSLIYFQLIAGRSGVSKLDALPITGVQLANGGKWSVLTGWLALLAAPLALNLVSTPYRIPMRALFAIPYVAWFVSTVWLELASRVGRAKFLMVGTVLTGILIAQSLVTISHYYAARAFNQRSDQLVASTIASVIAASPPGASLVTQLISKGSLP